jgi:hypothetical protein
MKIYIPTRGRPHNQETLKWFPENMIKDGTVVLAIDEDEKDKYDKYPDVQKLIVPSFVKGISYKRKYIIQQSTDPRVVMLDDDLRFYIRKSPTDWHLRYLESNEYPACLVCLMNGWIKGMLM